MLVNSDALKAETEKLLKETEELKESNVSASDS